MLRLPVAVLSIWVFAPSTAFAQGSPTTAQEKIQSAISAAPAYLAQAAAVLDTDPEGTVLRQGSNGWTCFPATTDFDVPICMDEVYLATTRGRESRMDRMGVAYMLRGGPSNEQGTQGLGPHVMIALPEGQPLGAWMADTHRPQGPFVLDNSGGTVLIIPVGAPGTSIR